VFVRHGCSQPSRLASWRALVSLAS
jgi:hypothetical protein